MAEMNLREAVARGLREALDNDDRVFMIGEDIGAYGGPYAVTKGFLEKYGAERIKDSPLGESIIVGSAIGAAMAGLRPIAEIMTINFMLLAMDQVINNAAKLRYMSDGHITVPVIIRTVTGGGGNLGATHSQSFEPWFASVPGLKVVVPSSPYDALGLFRTALKEQDPIIFSEHSLLYGVRGDVPDEHYEVPFGQAHVARPGTDVTMVAYSRMVHTALQAAQTLEARDVSAEVIDLRTLRPLDVDTVIQSVKKTGRAIVVEEFWRTGGFAAEVASQIQEKAFDYLDGPVGRVGGVEVPAPYSSKLEPAAIPDDRSIIREIEKTFGI